METVSRRPNDVQLIEVLANMTLNLYRAACAALSAPYVAEMYDHMTDPQPGDLVVDINDWHTPAPGRVAILHYVMRMTAAGRYVCLVQLTNGSYRTWRNAKLIKVLDIPFNRPQCPKEAEDNAHS